MTNESPSVDPEALAEAVDLATAVQYSPQLSEEMVRAVHGLIDGLEQNHNPTLLATQLERFPQLDPSVQSFLLGQMQSSSSAHRGELNGLLLALLATTKPIVQRRIVEQYGPLLDPVERATTLRTIESVFDLASLADAIQHQALQAGEFERGREEAFFRRWLSLPPEAKSIFQSTIDSLISNAYDSLNSGFFLLALGTLPIAERISNRAIIDQLLKTADPAERIQYFENVTPTERSERQQMMDETVAALHQHALAEAKYHRPPKIELSFFAHLSPGERQLYAPTIQELLEAQFIHESSRPEGVLEYYGELTSAERAEQAGVWTQAISQLFSTPTSDIGPKAQAAVFLTFAGRLDSIERVDLQSTIDQCLTLLAPTADDQDEPTRARRDPRAVLAYVATLPIDSQHQYQFLINQAETALITDAVSIHGRLVPMEYWSSRAPQERAERQSAIEQLYYETLSAQKIKPRPVGFAFPTKDIWEVTEAILKYYAQVTPVERATNAAFITQVITTAREEHRWAALAEYETALTDTERTPLENVRLPQRFLTSLRSELGDIGLRAGAQNLLRRQLHQRETSLALLDRLAVPADRLALTVGLKSLGLNAEAGLSWMLTSVEYQQLVTSVERLAQSKALSDIPLTLPFHARKESTPDFEPRLIEWFRALEFLDALGKRLDAAAALRDHIDTLESIQVASRITATSDDVPYATLKLMLREVLEVQRGISERFRKLVGLEALTPVDFRQFVEHWNGEIDAVITLAARLNARYPTVKEVLRQVVKTELAGTFTKFRYDWDDPLVRGQLNPLVANRSESERQAILGAFKEGVVLVSTEDGVVQAAATEHYQLPEHTRSLLWRNLAEHSHLRHSWFANAEFAALSIAEQDEVEAFVVGALQDPTTRSDFLLPVVTFKQKFGDRFEASTLKALIQLRQFFEDLAGNRRTAPVLAQSLRRLIDRLPPPLRETAMITNDLGQSLLAELDQVVIGEPLLAQSRVLMTHTSDHPKTLLEIGKYPVNSGSCQSYDYSDLELPKSLLGYVVDSHIRAIVLRELPEMTEIVEVISIDEGRQTALVKTADGTELQTPISRPIDRAMIFVGAADQPVIVQQPSYLEPGAIDPERGEALLTAATDAFIHQLRAAGVDGLRRATDDEVVTIAGSRNPAGHYNDRRRGQAGQDGANYRLNGPEDEDEDEN